MGSEGKAGGGLESPGCSQAVPPHRILPCSTERNHYVQSSIIKTASSQGLRSHGAAKQLLTSQAPCRNTAKRPPDTVQWHVPSLATGGPHSDNSIAGAAMSCR